MNQPVINVESAWKKYPRSHVAARRHAARQLARSIVGRRDDSIRPGEVWALKDLCLSANRGEVIGLIGLNGSGKSTVLKLIAGLLQPDRGICEVRGRVSSFINLSSGLNQSLSGRENVFLKGAIEGRSRSEMHASLEAVVEFSGLGKSIDSPVGTYSTGMRMRLAFAIAAHTEPDVLLVDEVLSVGDFEFRQKCLARMQLLRRNAAVVLVSHSMNDISRFCDRAIVLEAGKVNFDGDVGDAIRVYRNAEDRSNRSGISTSHVEREYENPDALCVESLSLEVDDHADLQALPGIKSLRLRVTIVAQRDLRNLVIGVPIKNRAGEIVTALSSEQAGDAVSAARGERISLELKVAGLGLNPGRYVVVIGIVDGPEFLYRKVVSEIRIKDDGVPFWGAFTPQASWSWDTES